MMIKHLKLAGLNSKIETPYLNTQTLKTIYQNTNVLKRLFLESLKFKTSLNDTNMTSSEKGKNSFLERLLLTSTFALEEHASLQYQYWFVLQKSLSNNVFFNTYKFSNHGQ